MQQFVGKPNLPINVKKRTLLIPLQQAKHNCPSKNSFSHFLNYLNGTKETSLNWFLKRVGYPRQGAAQVLGLDYEGSIKDGIPQHKARTYLLKGLEILMMCKLL
jgi:hypothetical protein